MAALRRATSAVTGPGERSAVELLRDQFLRNLVQDAGPFSAEQLPIVEFLVEVVDLVESRWASGDLTGRQARTRIILACKLLDLPSAEVNAATAAAIESS
ncbi:hypothetical protein SAMN05216554_4096 [Herbiconiux ginsengi]|uniref:Uncharacterized protein n=2 Tax=Herbiconiux ginsengi TaxID=381665 RepID=A0A1H3TFQ4_9MICO|nr:hypothetical protein SAMN05216554_4096 [Herbiconiux ginsengi]